MKTFISVFLLLMFVGCTKDPLIIEDFKAANVDKILRENDRYVSQHYLVHNYRNTIEHELLIQEHLCAHLRPDYKEIDSYFVSYYKYSDLVNNQAFIRKKKFCEMEMVYNIVFLYEFRGEKLEKRKFMNNNEVQSRYKHHCDKKEAG